MLEELICILKVHEVVLQKHIVKEKKRKSLSFNALKQKNEKFCDCLV